MLPSKYLEPFIYRCDGAIGSVKLGMNFLVAASFFASRVSTMTVLPTTLGPQTKCKGNNDNAHSRSDIQGTG